MNTEYGVTRICQQRQSARQVLKEVEYGLVANNWIDENTQALYVQTAVLNAEEALLCLLQAPRR